MSKEQFKFKHKQHKGIIDKINLSKEGLKFTRKQHKEIIGKINKGLICKGIYEEESITIEYYLSKWFQLITLIISPILPFIFGFHNIAELKEEVIDIIKNEEGGRRKYYKEAKNEGENKYDKLKKVYMKQKKKEC